MQKILIVDDHPTMRQFIRQVIEQESGWQVCGEAANGAEGVSAVERLKPDIVLLDASMPVMDGIEAAILIKKRRPETRLLIFTSYPTPSIEEAARSIGVTFFPRWSICTFRRRRKSASACPLYPVPT